MEGCNPATSFFDPNFGVSPRQVVDGEREIPDSLDNERRRAEDSVAVSQHALLLTEALRVARNTPDVRAEKLEMIRQRIAAGTYEIDAKKIAFSLIREEPGLFMR